MGKKKVTHEEQKAMGLIRETPKNLMLPTVSAQVPARRDTNDSIMLNVTPSAQQIARLETSYVDKAKGFHIAFTPIALFAGGVVLTMAIFYKNIELWSLVALMIYAGSVLVVWLLAWLFTLLLGPEMVSFYEAWRKWNVVDREQTERHRYYRGGKK